MEAWGVFQDDFVPPLPVKMAPFPGFLAVNDQIFCRDPEESSAAQSPPADYPTDLILFAWGDGLPKHVLKYSDGFRAAFPHTRQIVVLGPISKALHSDTAARTRDMLPIVNTLFPQPSDAKPEEPPADEGHSQRRILCHIMSNTGGINYASFLNAYRTLYGHPLQHPLASFDSTPGTTVLHWANLKRWSHAMAMGTAKWFPWPYTVTQVLWGATLLANRGWENVIGKESAAPWSQRATYNEDIASKNTRRLYLFSKEDEMIGWEDVQMFSEQSEQGGWKVERQMFEGSGHVGHMRMHPDLYWKAISTAWGNAMAEWKVGV